MSKTEDKAVNLVELVRLGCAISQAVALQRLARSLHRIYVADSNRGLTAGQELRAIRLCNAVDDIARDANLHAYHQSDPRGWPIILHKSPITEADTWGKVRVCPY